MNANTRATVLWLTGQIGGYDCSVVGKQFPNIIRLLNIVAVVFSTRHAMEPNEIVIAPFLLLNGRATTPTPLTYKRVFLAQYDRSGLKNEETMGKWFWLRPHHFWQHRNNIIIRNAIKNDKEKKGQEQSRATKEAKEGQRQKIETERDVLNMIRWSTLTRMGRVRGKHSWTPENEMVWTMPPSTMIFPFLYRFHCHLPLPKW